MAMQGFRHPREFRIERRDPEHTYFVDGCCFMYRSVTQLLDDYKPFNAEEVFLNHYPRWQDSPRRKPQYYNKLRHEIQAEWTEAREKGTAMHTAIEAFLEGGQLTLANDDIVLSQLRKFFSSTDFRKPSHNEMLVFDEDLRIAGAVDLVYDSNKEGITIYDWKRSVPDGRAFDSNNDLPEMLDCKLGKWSVQVNLYAKILQEKYGFNVKAMKIVCFHPSLKNPMVLDIEPTPDLMDRITMDRKQYLEYHADMLKSASQLQIHSNYCNCCLFRDSMHHGFSESCFHHVMELCKQFQHVPESIIDARIVDQLLPWRSAAWFSDSSRCRFDLPRLLITALGEKISLRFRDPEGWDAFTSNPEVCISIQEDGGELTIDEFDRYWKAHQKGWKNIRNWVCNVTEADVKRRRIGHQLEQPNYNVASQVLLNVKQEIDPDSIPVDRFLGAEVHIDEDPEWNQNEAMNSAIFVHSMNCLPCVSASRPGKAQCVTCARALAGASSISIAQSTLTVCTEVIGDGPKCFLPCTKFVKADGSSVFVGNLCHGDELQGPEPEKLASIQEILPHASNYRSVVDITIEMLSGKVSICVTDDHRLTLKKGDYKRARDVQPGDLLTTTEGECKVLATNLVRANTEVFEVTFVEDRPVFIAHEGLLGMVAAYGSDQRVPYQAAEFVEFGFKGSICMPPFSAEAWLDRDLITNFGLKFWNTRKYAVWVPQARADECWNAVKDRLPRDSKLYRRPQLRSVPSLLASDEVKTPPPVTP